MNLFRAGAFLLPYRRMTAIFTGIVTVKIEKDRNFARYCRIIREYDGSLSLSQIKKAIDAGEVVFSFDPACNPLIADGKTGSVLFLETYFIKTLRALEAAGAGMIVTEEPCGHIIKDFGPPMKQTMEAESEPASASVMEQIDKNGHCPQNTGIIWHCMPGAGQPGSRTKRPWKGQS